MAGSRGLLCAALCVAIAGPPAAAESPAPRLAQVLETKPPAGFEALTEPRELLLEVFFAGRALGLFVAIHRPGALRLLDPDAVLAAVPELDPAGAAGVRLVLAGDLAPNGALVCLPARAAGCGQLEPAVAGVILDEARLRLDLFLAPDRLRPATVTGPRHLGGATAEGVSFFNPLAAYVSSGFASANGEESLLTYSIQSDSYLSQGPLSFHLAASYGNELSFRDRDEEPPGFAIDEAAALLVRPGWLYEGGLLRSAPMPLVGTSRIAGVSIGTTTLTRTDIAGARGSPLTVFLPSRSVVDLVVDGRIVSRQAYGPGNQLLDTAALPDGGYEVEIVVHEAGGGESRQTQFFAKSAQVPPADQPSYVAELGLLARDDREELIGITGEPFFRLGGLWRVTDELALGADLTGGRELVATALTGTLFTDLGLVTLTGLGASDGSVGVGLSGFGAIPGTAVHYSVFGQYLERGDEPADEAIYDGTDLLGGSFRQLSLSLSMPLGEHATLGLLGGYREDQLAEATWNVGPRLTLDLSPWLGLDLLLDAGITMTDDETVALVQFRLFETFGERRRWSSATALGALAVLDEEHETQRYAGRYNPVAATELQWSDGDLWAETVRAHGGLRYQQDRDLDAFIGADYEGEQIALEGDLVYTRANRDRDSGGLAATASAQTAIAYADGAFALGRGEGGEAGIVVELAGEAPDTLYDVLVNGYPVARLAGAGATGIQLPPFASYEVALRPVGGALVDLDSRARQVTLYPGNMVTLRWSVAPTVAAFGRALMPSGAPLARARLEGPRGIAITDDQGYFQIDMAADDASVRGFARGGAGCLLALPEIRPANDTRYLNLGDVLCH